MKKIVVMLSILMLFTAAPGWTMCGAADHWISEKVQSDSYSEKMMGLFLDGLHRVAESPFELAYHPYDHIANQKKYATGLFTGLGEGLYRAVENIGIGVVNIISAPIPNYHGVTREHDHELFSGRSGTTA